MKCFSVFLLAASIGFLFIGCQNVQDKNVEGAGKLEEPKPVGPVQPVKGEPPQPVDLDTDPALMGWWKFEETTGTKAADSSPYGRKGELKGEFTFDKDSVAGKVGKALRFDGKKNMVQIAGYKGVTGTKARTLTAWIKTKRSRNAVPERPGTGTG